MRVHYQTWPLVLLLTCRDIVFKSPSDRSKKCSLTSERIRTGNPTVTLAAAEGTLPLKHFQTGLSSFAEIYLSRLTFRRTRWATIVEGPRRHLITFEWYYTETSWWLSLLTKRKSEHWHHLPSNQKRKPKWSDMSSGSSRNMKWRNTRFTRTDRIMSCRQRQLICCCPLTGHVSNRQLYFRAGICLFHT